MMKKLIPVAIAVILILVIGGVMFAQMYQEKYSYSEERADLNEYFQVSGDQLAIILQDEMVEEKAILRNGRCYFDLETVDKYLNDGFYVDDEEGLLIYTTATQIHSTALGETVMYTKDGVREEASALELGYEAFCKENERVYVAADYIRQFTNCSVSVFDRHVQIYTQWGSKETDVIQKDTALRVKGGVKSPVLCDLTAGTEVEVLERMETWCKVKTQDSLIGYVELKRLASKMQGTIVEEVPVTDCQEPEYTNIALDGKVSLGWHAIGGVGGNVTLEETVAGTKGMNVIAPTWFSMCDSEGNFRDFSQKSYVDRAHNMGLQVWGVWDDFNYHNETGNEVSVLSALSATRRRQDVVWSMVSKALELGLDGINIDFERITDQSGPHFAQMLRELSVECRKNGLVLSVDNYVPYDYRDCYHIDVQGEVADYVIIMGYDEHWHNSADPGSVASIGYVTYGITKALENVPASKLVNGLPFYTILWKTAGSKVTDEYLTMNNTEDFLNRVNVTPEWDDETCQNYAEWTGNGVTYQVWLEDADSITAKLGVMRSHDIAGVAVWRLGYGTEEVWNLLNAYTNQ